MGSIPVVPTGQFVTASFSICFDIYSMKNYVCKYCGKETKPLGFSSHQRLCPSNPQVTKENHPSYGKRGTPNQYTKGAKMGEETKKKISKAFKGKNLSEEHKNKIKESMVLAVKNNPLSYSSSNVSGRVKIYEHGGFKLKGKWELDVAKWLDSQSIRWTNLIDPFEYFWEGSFHQYFPDFYLLDLDLYIEVKGFQTSRDLEKWKVVKNLVVFKRKEIDDIRKGLYRL